MEASIGSPQYNHTYNVEQSPGSEARMSTSFRSLDLNDTRSPLRKPVFQADSSSSEWETDSEEDEDGVLRKLLKPNPRDLGNFKNGIPENGSQYLYTVIKEARKAPKLVTAVNQDEIQQRVKQRELEVANAKVPVYFISGEQVTLRRSFNAVIYHVRLQVDFDFAVFVVERFE